jgi:hypothetical protein
MITHNLSGRRLLYVSLGREERWISALNGRTIEAAIVAATGYAIRIGARRCTAQRR